MIGLPGAAALLLAATSLASAAEHPRLVPRDPDLREVRLVVPAGGVAPDDFVAAVLDCDGYPTDASYFGTHPMVGCRTLEHTDLGWAIVHLHTGGGAVVAERQSLLAMRLVERSDQRVRLEWDLLQPDGEPGAWQGPYAKVLAALPDAIYTPANSGSWTLDLSAATITYSVQVDVGGSVPAFVISDASVLTFPRRFLEVRLGLQP